MTDREPSNSSDSNPRSPPNSAAELEKSSDAAERRRIQNRNSQRIYRQNLKDIKTQQRQEKDSNPSKTGRSSLCSASGSESSARASRTNPTSIKRSISKEGDPQTPLEGLPTVDFYGFDGTLRAMLDDSFTLDGSEIQLTLQNLDTGDISKFPTFDSDSTTALWTNNRPFLPNSVLQPISDDYLTMEHLDSFSSEGRTIRTSSMDNRKSSGNNDQVNQIHIPSINNQMVSILNGSPLQRVNFTSSESPKKGGTSLHLAAKNGHLGVAHVLLQAGMNVDVEDEAGCTPLHQAAEAGQETMVSLLLSRGADMNAVVGALRKME